MLKLSCALLLTWSILFGQTSPVPAGTLVGVVHDPSGKPLSNISVVLTGSPKGRQTATTGDHGEFRFTELPPALYRLTAMAPTEVLGTKAIALDAGQEIADIEISVSPTGTISGRVLDENREPVHDFDVLLMAAVFQAGERRYELQQKVTPDAQGKYLLRDVKPDLSYRLLARRRTSALEPNSKAPADPEKRQPEPAESWFPDAPSVEGGSPLMLFPGEQREAVDIRVRRQAPRCVEATLETAAGPGVLVYQLIDSSGNVVAFGRTATDGQLRDCRPEHNALLLLATRDGQSDNVLGSAAIPAGAADVSKLRVLAQPQITLRGTVALDGEAPPPEGGTLSVGLSALDRTRLGSETPIGADLTKSPIPGSFSLQVFASESLLTTVLANVPKAFYIKEVTCAGVKVSGNRVRLGSATGNPELHIVIGRDGGSLGVQVQDAHGKPVSDAWVVASPANAGSESEMSYRLWGGPANATGAFVDSIKPGKYLVVATSTWLNLNTETVARFWRARGKATEVDIGPGANVHLTLALSKVE